MIQAMVDKGLSGQDIADIAKAGEVKVDRTAAERQARHRAKSRVARNGVTSRRDPLIEDHNPGSHISPDGENENKPRKPRGSVCVRPDDIPDELWKAWVDHRLKHKADAGQTTIDAYRREADEVGWTLQQALTEQIQRGWRGFKAKWVKDDDQTQQRSGFSGQGNTRDIGMEIAAELAAKPTGGGGVVDIVPRLGAPGRAFG